MLKKNSPYFYEMILLRIAPGKSKINSFMKRPACESHFAKLTIFGGLLFLLHSVQIIIINTNNRHDITEILLKVALNTINQTININNIINKNIRNTNL